MNIIKVEHLKKEYRIKDRIVAVEILRKIIIGVSPHSYIYNINILALFGAIMILFAVRGFLKTE